MKSWGLPNLFNRFKKKKKKQQQTLIPSTKRSHSFALMNGYFLKNGRKGTCFLLCSSTAKRARSWISRSLRDEESLIPPTRAIATTVLAKQKQHSRETRARAPTFIFILQRYPSQPTHAFSLCFKTPLRRHTRLPAPPTSLDSGDWNLLSPCFLPHFPIQRSVIRLFGARWLYLIGLNRD